MRSSLELTRPASSADRDVIEVRGVDGEPVIVDIGALERLSAAIEGSVLTPGNAGFDKAVEIWNAIVKKRPSLVVQPLSAEDVRKTVTFAREHGLLLSIKSGGHNVAGTSLADGGMTLDLSRMKSVEVDPERRRVHVGAGCVLGEVDQATQQYGLATVLGTVSETGVAGLTLGGGFGHLTRRYGWTVDNLEEVDIVTAEGQLRRAAADENEELFWALRGGGGNFGVVTQFIYRPREVGPQVTGGIVLWDAAEAPAVLAAYRDLTELGPRAVSLLLTLRPAPAEPFVPEAWRGRPVVGTVVCHTGDLAQAERDLRGLRSIGNPIVDSVGVRPYVEVQTLLDRSQPDGLCNYWKSEFLPRLPDELFPLLQERASAIESPRSQMLLMSLGGALREFDPAATPFSNREAVHFFFAAACWEGGDPLGDRHRAWARTTWEAVRPHSTGGSYINAQTADEDDARVAEAYGAGLGRLGRAKAAYDPDNFFRVNRNIAPVA